MDSFDFWAKEWPVVTQAPLIVIPGAIVVFLLGVGITWSLFTRQIETLKERLAFANEKAAAAKEDNATLTKRIQSDARKGDILKSAKSTADAIDQISAATSRTAIVSDWDRLIRSRLSRLPRSG
jgi:hypothetical protein